MINLRAEDIIYLEELQKDYNNTTNYYNDLAEFMEGWNPAITNNSHFYTNTGLTYDIKTVKSEDKNKVTTYFIQYICRHFRNVYGLSSLTDYIESKILNKYVKYNFTIYNNDNLHYKDIIKNICEELNIKNFGSASIDDLRSRIINKLEYYWKNERIIISNNKIKITDFGFSLHYNWNNSECYLEDSTFNFYSDVLTALNYIINGNLEVPERLNQGLKKLSSFQSKIKTSEFFKTYDVKDLGIVSIRFYKNRSIDVKFNSEQATKTFIRVLKGEF